VAEEGGGRAGRSSESLNTRMRRGMEGFYWPTATNTCSLCFVSLLWPTHGGRGNGNGSYLPNVLNQFLTGGLANPPCRFVSAKRWMIVTVQQGSMDLESCPRALAHIVIPDEALAD
jgi:hypothetical protein